MIQGRLLVGFVNFLFQLGVEPRAHIRRKIDRFVVAENLHRQLSLSHDDRATFAFAEMLFQFDADRGFQLAVDVTRDFANAAGAVQLGFLSRKKRSSFWRSFNRARSSRDFTAGTEIPIACAVSSVESSSMSRSTNTVRKSGSSESITLSRISCNSD